MPIKGQSPKEVVHTEMHKFKHGTLHSGSKHGPKVKSRDQAIAIALSESGQSKYDRSAHHKGNPGFPSSSEDGGSPPPKSFQSHETRERDIMGAGYKQHESTRSNLGAPHGFGHIGSQKSGTFRLSGHPGAHRIGKK